jgi:hypothetical protein
MAAIYADHPYPLIPTPTSLKLGKGEKTDIFDDVASTMALVHNMMIRGLNAIYLQAPHILPSDAKPFCQFAIRWHTLIHIHHAGEEEDLFRNIEEMAGEKGIMDSNVEQHHAFHEGLAEFRAYVTACAVGKETYDGGKLVRIIDGFGPTLVEHLGDEIPSLENLRKYGVEKMKDLPRKFDEEGKKSMQALGLMGLVTILAEIDIHYEGGLWRAFPPAPGVLIFLLRNVFWWFAVGTVKFAPCDRHGRMKPLYAVPAQTG